ncbi:MAG: bifunctional diguanylate cyclase/phosphodiesterase [Methylobacterium sp.]|nr:bifunctional diguanylate cyclase/phosphodiesterase [Methylobacterium sp.]
MKYYSYQLDPTSGFLDRNGCLHMAGEMITKARETGQPLAALWLDIDRFKQINESLGYLGSDNAIAIISARLGEKLKNRAEIGRVGADEFVFLVPNCAMAQVEKLAQEAMQIIEPKLDLGAVSFRPTASVGIALFEPDDDAFSFIERADRAKMAAKRQGGNRYVVSGQEPVPGPLGAMIVREELDVEYKLHTALENGGLRLHYQPIVDASGKVQSVEALMRCNAGGENISPARFIPVAEKTGLIVRLGEWCLLQGARHARHLSDAGFALKTAINVSRSQLVDARFTQALNAALICADVPPELIELELTESLFVDVSETVQSNLRAARELGVDLAIDDFGTGYSCLADLKDIPASKLKLDRAFVKVLPQDRRALSVVKAMVQLGKELGMTVVAEGAETEAQVDALIGLGVDYIQGFYYARPMDAEALLTWLKARQQA